MAPRQLLLEGPAIEPLLEKVWAEHGPDVTIVKAERVRVGGVAGFFAREQFEVTVEIPDPAEPSPAAPPPAGQPSASKAPRSAPRASAPPQGLEALLAAAEQGDGRPGAASSRPASRPAARPAAPAAASTDFDAIFGSVAAGLPVPAAATPRAKPAPADDDDPWVDGPPADDARPGRRPLPARASAPKAAPAARAAAAVPAAAAEPAAPAGPVAAHDDDPTVPLTALPETPLVPAAGSAGEPDDAPGWQPPWEPARAGTESTGSTDGPAPAAESGPSVLRPEHLSALIAEHRSASGAASSASAPPPAVPEPAGAEQPSAVPARGSGLAVVGSLHGEPPPRVGRSFAPVPSAQPDVPAYSLQRSAVLRLPDTAVHPPSGPLLATAGPGAPHVVTSLGAAVPAAPSMAVSGLLAPGSTGDGWGADPWGHAAPLHDHQGHGYGVEPGHEPGPAPDPGDAAPFPHDAPFDGSSGREDRLFDQLSHGDHPGDGGRRARRGWDGEPGRSPLDQHLPERLAALGVPAAWLWDLPQGRSAALRELSARIAAAAAAGAATPRRHRPAPVAEPVVVVLADLEDAMPVAQHLATGMGLDVDGVVVMGRRAPGAPSQRCLPSRQEVAAEVAAARAEGRSLVVVLPAPVGAAPPARAAVADTLGHLAPDEVWAVVDATRRLDDTAAWLAAVAGERGVDALALTNTDVTSAPAAALALPAPVVLVGDRPAAPESWVSMLAGRLAEQDLR